MARFAGSKDRKGSSRDRSPRRDSDDSSSGRKTFEDHVKERGSSRGRGDSRSGGRGDSRGRGGRDSRGGRDFGGDRGGRGRLEMTKVICDECGSRCEVPFKPTSSKPIYCSDCFEKKGNGNSRSSNNDLDIVNKKLDKIMKALKIE